ncbi:MAG: hypothetical protein M1G31_18605 [Pseudanabaena sp. Salubria-1]|jgi:hypothetical protein|nr:hypothetical protein [Pseudanabaena sp. Salubria-1]
MQQLQQIHQDIDSLPNEAQGLLFDFVQILKKRYLVSIQKEVSQDRAEASDPLVGLFAGSPNLSMDAEEILKSEITSKSGWSCKE